MASAYYANKYNMPFTVYESTNSIGGNCRTMEFGQFRFDTGAHRFHDKIPKITLEMKKILGSDLMKVSAPSKIFCNDNFINFPIQLIDIIKTLDPYLIFKLIKELINNQLIEEKKYSNFKNFAYQTYGKTISDLFLLNYTEKLWGLKPELLSHDVSGGRLRNLNVLSFIKDLLYINNNPKHLDGSFFYPKNYLIGLNIFSSS